MNTEHERRLSVSGCSNFRDLGGYVTADKKFRTRWNRIYRSDSLSKMERTNQAAHLLCDTLRVKTVIDFRGESEKRQDAYGFPGVDRYEIAVEPGDVMNVLMGTSVVGEAAAANVMRDLNGLFVTDFKEQYRTFLRLVIEKGSRSRDEALVFHCTAGKDRTGYGAALILLLLGVDRETVYADYMLTNEYYTPPPFERVRKSIPGDRVIEDDALKALFYVRKDYLDRALDCIDEKYGGIQSYVEKELGIAEKEIDQLKAAFLEPLDC